ncbi:MAG: class I SAM-dependent methyltransferase, partial [Hyphomonadaceae bacterium]
MRKTTIDRLRAPESGARLDLRIFEAEGDDVVEGCLIDADDQQWFRIENGVADLLPSSLRRHDRHRAFADRHGLEIGNAICVEASAPHKHQLEFFGRYHQEYERDVVESPFYRVLDGVTLGRWISRSLAPGCVVAELGAGSGRQTLPLLKHGVEVIGLDLSEEMLVLARQKALDAKNRGRADFVVASAEQLPLAEESVDAALIYGSLHHFADPEASLREASKVMREG